MYDPCEGPNIDSDHFLLKTTLKQKLPNIYKKKPILLTKLNKTNIQDPSKLRQYRTSLHNKLKNTPDTNNIKEEWERIKETITDAANEYKYRAEPQEMNGGVKSVEST